jgi:hypothetical protein
MKSDSFNIQYSEIDIQYSLFNPVRHLTYDMSGAYPNLSHLIIPHGLYHKIFMARAMMVNTSSHAIV